MKKLDSGVEEVTGYQVGDLIADLSANLLANRFEI